MQSLINQIAGLFAAQSINSIENNEIGYSLGDNQGFNSLFESQINNSNTANLAVYEGQSLPPASYTPLSFQISQVTLSAASLVVEGGAELKSDFTHAEIVHGDVNYLAFDHLVETTSGNATAATVSEIDSSAALVGVARDADSIVKQVTASNADQVAPPVTITKNLPSDQAGQDEYARNTQVAHTQNANKSTLENNPVTQQTIDKGQTRYVNNTKIQTSVSDVNVSHSKNNTPLKEAINNNVNLEPEPRSNRYNSAEQNAVQTIAQVSINKNHSVQETPNNANTVGVSDRHLNGKIQDSSHLTNNVSPSNHIANDGEEVLPIKADTILRVNTNNVEAEAKVSPAVDIRKQVVNPANSQQLSNSEEITKQVSPELTEENSTNRPIYNANQYSEVKRNETSYRNDRAPINLQSYDNSSEIKPSELASRISQNFDNQLDVSDSVNKSQSISHEGKPLANTNIAHNPQTSTAASDPISALNKLTTLDKPTTQLSVNSQVNNGDELAQQITWARNSNTNHVKIALAPEHLGALEITIDQDSDGLNIQFTTQNTLAKDAIETFMPRLKEMLEQQGLNLHNANVSQENNGNHSYAYSQEGEQYNIDNVQEGVQIASNSEQDIPHASSNNYLLEAFA